MSHWIEHVEKHFTRIATEHPEWFAGEWTAEERAAWAKEAYVTEVRAILQTFGDGRFVRTPEQGVRVVMYVGWMKRLPRTTLEWRMATFPKVEAAQAEMDAAQRDGELQKVETARQKLQKENEELRDEISVLISKVRK
jgi:hypothetical protein